MSQMATVLSFGHHYHPEEVNHEVRERMVHNLSIDQLIWSGFIALIGAILAVGSAIVDSVDKTSPALYWHLGTVLALALWAEMICYFVFDSRKRFVLNMPATTAVVVRQRDTLDLAQGVPRVLVRYLPRLGEQFDPEKLRTADEAFTAWGDLDGLSPQFEQNLHPGDLVTILYDPGRPSHIKLVEFEH